MQSFVNMLVPRWSINWPLATFRNICWSMTKEKTLRVGIGTTLETTLASSEQTTHNGVFSSF